MTSLDGLAIGVLFIQSLLWLSERLQWFTLNHYRGAAMTAALVTVGVPPLAILARLAFWLAFGWRFQFTIRSLLLVLLATALPLTWFATERQALKQQREAEGGL